MISRRYTPGPPLCDFVELFWLYQGTPAKPHAKERLLPDGSVELVINLREDEIRVYDREETDCYQRLKGSIVCGPHSQFFVIDTASQESVMGIHFKPGGAFPFLGVPTVAVRNLHVSLDDLWGGAAARLRQRLLEAPTPEGKFDVLEKALLARAGGRLGHHPAVAYALKEFQGKPGIRTIAEVSSQMGFSAKRFIQVFSQEVGLTPKLFCRVRRFQRVIRGLAAGRSVEWADVAVEGGYYDQAHFIHDFNAFSGINPSTYLAQRTEHQNHVPLS